MENWIDTPIIITVAIAVVSVLVAIGIWVGSVNSDRSKFNEFMKEVRDDIKKILGRLPPLAVASNSPLRLTEFGEAIAKQTNAEEWSEQIAPELAKEVESKQPYEIQELCFNYVQEKLGNYIPK